ncbi:hypothetical protein PYCCODRAFT_1427927 [Trametes coccinea BRFM310]|uniref:F-box domain-containing protein n=1 Tax=Trametes coccinea (strain BRFM310) TaxID=1353009 RepID=A0A1Y2ICR2_TRAC3|nr:hypothetical protein PYCCODRAFT_1427927 [Trametes coccinea BRFM310]
MVMDALAAPAPPVVDFDKTVKILFPFELLAHIVGYIGDDNDALRNLCLSSRALHAISYPLLFALRDFRALQYAHLKPFLPYVRELRISWKPDMQRDRDAEVLARSLQPYLSSEATPRLQKLIIRGISADGMAYLNTLSPALNSFASLTSLLLNETYHRDMRDVQVLITSLPHLAHLSLNALTWISPDFNECPDSESTEFLDRPALRSLRVSPVYPSCMLPLLTWLARTPTACTLQTLEVPATARIGPDALSHFGQSVRHLSVPMRGLRPTLFEKYTSLESLDVYVGIDDFLTQQYARLPEVVEVLPCRGTLRNLTIHIPHEATVTVGGPSDVFGRLDDILFGPAKAVNDEATPGHEESPPFSFAMLREFKIVFQTAGMAKMQDREDTDWCERLQMWRASELGKLAIAFERDETMAYAFACRPGVVPKNAIRL